MEVVRITTNVATFCFCCDSDSAFPWLPGTTLTLRDDVTLCCVPFGGATTQNVGRLLPKECNFQSLREILSSLKWDPEQHEKVVFTDQGTINVQNVYFDIHHGMVEGVFARRISKRLWLGTMSAAAMK